MNKYRSLQVKKHIESLDDVKEFFTDLCKEDLRIYPYNFFESVFGHRQDISPEMLARLDDTMERCCSMCESEGVDICELASGIYAAHDLNCMLY